jgi:hypothetical protein
MPAKAGIQYAAAYRFHHCCLWDTGSPAFAGDDDRIWRGILVAHGVRGLRAFVTMANTPHPP